MTDVRSMNRVLLAALLVITGLTLKPASAQAPAAGATAGGSSSITNTTTDKPGATTTTTTTTTSGIPTSGDSSTVAGTDLAPAASAAPATDEPTVPKIRGLANTGGEPALLSLAGMALASGALLLRRRLD